MRCITIAVISCVGVLCALALAPAANAATWWGPNAYATNGLHQHPKSGYVAQHEISMPAFGAWTVGSRYCSGGAVTDYSSSTTYLGVGIDAAKQSRPLFYNHNGTSRVTAFTVSGIGRPPC